MIVDKQDRTCAVVDIVQPWDKRVVEKENKKIEKYQEIKREIASMWNMRTVRASDTGCCRIIANCNKGNLEKLLGKLNIKIGTSLLKKIALYEGIRRYTLFSSDLVTTKDKDWVVNNIFS